MKAWWKVSDKPRGRWNPLFEFGIHLSEEEHRELGALNVSTKTLVCLIFPECSDSRRDMPPPAADDFVQCGRGYYVLRWPQCPYPTASRVPEAHAIYSSGCCQDCRFPAWRYADRTDINLADRHFSYRLPWRPGRRPDYSDYIEPTRHFLLRVLKELGCRIEEARESSPSGEWDLEEEFESYSIRETENVAVAERKLRVIRA